MRTTVESDGCILRLFGYSSMISNSMGVFDQMERLGVPKEKHFFVPNPIEFPQKLTFEEAIPVVRDFDIVDGQPYILFVGQLLHRKSIVEVVDAFEIFSATYTDCCLVLVGRNMIGSSIEQKVHRNRKILHIKPVARDKVAALMTCSQMIVQPSRVEGIPRVTLEALSLGKKVLLPPCVPEFKKNNEEFSIKEVSTREIADAMLRIYKTTNSPVYDLSVHDPSESAKVLRDVYTQTYRYA